MPDQDLEQRVTGAQDMISVSREIMQKARDLGENYVKMYEHEVIFRRPNPSPDDYATLQRYRDILAALDEALTKGAQ
jgi:hypothetical protein